MKKNKVSLFQIEQNYGGGSKAFVYFNANPELPIEKLKDLAYEELDKDWKKVCEGPRSFFGGHSVAKRTHLIKEMNGQRKKTNGISFKLKWRPSSFNY